MFSKYKVNCTNLYDLVKNARGNTPPSDSMEEKYKLLFEKKVGELTKSDNTILLNYLSSLYNYDPSILSSDVKSAIRKQFLYEYYGQGSIFSYEGKENLASAKSRYCELDAINTISIIDGKKYVKNEKLYQNSFFKGIPDIVYKKGRKVESVLDIKVCLDISSFTEKKFSKITDEHYWQMQGYIDLFNIDKATLVYILPDMPESLLSVIISNAESKWLSEGLDINSIIERRNSLISNCKYPNISLEDRIYRIEIQRNDFDIDRAKKRIPSVREYLDELILQMPKKING